jgi:septal ring factor EnvC (AmiA/AmiB activator)
MYYINIQELREYLITNKLYEPVDGEECMFAAKKDVEIKDDADQLLQLQNEIKRIEIVKDDMAEQIKKLELQLQKYEEDVHKKPKEDIAKKPKKKTTKKNDFVAISDTTFLDEITGKVFEIVEDNDMIDDEPF